MLSLILTLTFIGLMCLRVPVSFAIGLSTLIPLLIAGKSFVALPQYMQEGVNSVALLAVPFFDSRRQPLQYPRVKPPHLGFCQTFSRSRRVAWAMSWSSPI